MAVEKWTPERRRALTRSALIDAARQVFAQRGFEGASLDEIAETAGYTRGAIYKHFSDKEDLFWAVNDDFNDGALKVFAERLGKSKAPLDVDAIAETWQQLLPGDPDTLALALEFQLYELRNPSARERSVARVQQTRALFADFIEREAAAAGTTLTLPADTLAAIFLIASDGFNRAALVETPGENLFATFLKLFLPTVARERSTDRTPSQTDA